MWFVSWWSFLGHCVTKRSQQKTFKALYSLQSKLEDMTSLSVIGVSALSVKTRLTESDVDSPPYKAVFKFWFCTLVFILLF